MTRTPWLFGAAALSLMLAAASPPALAAQNNNGDRTPACTFVDEHRYYCVLDGHSYICPTNLPSSIKECTPALRVHPGQTTIKGLPGLTKKAP